MASLVEIVALRVAAFSVIVGCFDADLSEKESGVHVAVYGTRFFDGDE
jgi:hypothetical protein